MFATALHDIIGLQNFSLSFCQSLSGITMCNLHWCYTFCTGVTLELHCSSQSESSNFFMCIITMFNNLGLVVHPEKSVFNWSLRRDWYFWVLFWTLFLCMRISLPGEGMHACQQLVHTVLPSVRTSLSLGATNIQFSGSNVRIPPLPME